MWYEEENQLVRAETPRAFDHLVQNLEDGDSVVFESISLPSATRKSARSIRSSVRSVGSSFSDEFEPIPEAEEIDILRHQIKAALERSAQKDQMIRDRDARISDLQSQITRIEAQSPREDPELLAYYKGQYETTAYQFEKLKEALAGGLPDHGARRK
jgi:phage terminase Nu1 subunit (DNA packaging protein)